MRLQEGTSNRRILDKDIDKEDSEQRDCVCDMVINPYCNVPRNESDVPFITGKKTIIAVSFQARL